MDSDPFSPNLPHNTPQELPKDLPEPLRKMLEDLRSKGMGVGLINVTLDGEVSVAGDSPPPQYAKDFEAILRQAKSMALGDSVKKRSPERKAATEKMARLTKEIYTENDPGSDVFAMNQLNLGDDTEQVIEDGLIELTMIMARKEFKPAAIEKLVAETSFFERLTGVIEFAFTLGALWMRSEGESPTGTETE